MKQVQKVLKLARSLRKPALKLVSPRHREMYAAHRQWKRDGAEARRFDYPYLNADSTVIDLGGFRGEWADGIFVRYQPNIHVFEPHPRFAKALIDKYSHNPRIRVHACALGSEDGEFKLGDLGDASSSYHSQGHRHVCATVEAGAHLALFQVNSVDLIKINIEGGEYDIVPHLARIGFLPRIKTLQIQFHLVTGQSPDERDAIRDMLRQTHREAWCYPLVWEQWERL